MLRWEDDTSLARTLLLALAPHAPNLRLCRRVSFLYAFRVAPVKLMEAEVQFSKLTPRLPGLWQINTGVPNDAGVGQEISLVVLQGQVSNELSIAVQ